MADRSGFPWRAVLDVSTGYLTPETRAAMDAWTHETAPTFFGRTDYGWFIYCPLEYREEADVDWPADLREVLTWARAQGADYVLFDADGCDTHEGLTWREPNPPQGIAA
jgi:hypothetical protein